MKEIQLRDAKASLSAVVDSAVKGEGTIITRRGQRDAVVISYAEYRKLTTVPSFGRLLAASPLEDDDLPVRKPARALGRRTR
jgi:prevent-host-death family protein